MAVVNVLARKFWRERQHDVAPARPRLLTLSLPLTLADRLVSNNRQSGKFAGRSKTRLHYELGPIDTDVLVYHPL